VNTSTVEYPESYPDRLRIAGRAVDNVFEPTECLYLRFVSYDPQTGRPDFGDIRCPDQSVNRSKYSEPDDVLWCRQVYLKEQGFGSFFVSQIPPLLRDGKGQEIGFRVEHDPVIESIVDLENYSHSEVRAHNQTGRQRKVSKLIKTMFQQSIAEALSVLKLPRAI
jgi:uncharacterized NAD(P)/FAD-binding protein YdhS